MTQRPFALNPADDSDIVNVRMRAARLERLCGELAAEVSDLSQLAASLATQDRGEPKALLSVDECAKTLGLSRTTTFGLVRSAQLPSFKVGSRRLVRRADLERFISLSNETTTSRAG